MADLDPAGRRHRRKEQKNVADPRPPMARRRAYQAAQEVLEQGLDLWKMADRKARLALMLLGPLNIVLLILLSNYAIFDAIPRRERVIILIGIAVYFALATTMCLLVIGALRPEQADPVTGAPSRRSDATSLGIRHYEDILKWDVEAYQRAWRTVTREQLVAEVAEQAHAVAVANRRKFRSLHYLFRGLQGMTALALLLLLATMATLVFEGQAEKIRLKHGVEVTLPARLRPATRGGT